MLLAALWKRMPVVVMEPNAVPGFTHRRLARFVARALVSFPETVALVSARDAPKSPACRCARNFSPCRRRRRERQPLTVLITGGSQGSRTLNRAAEESWPLWNARAPCA